MGESTFGAMVGLDESTLRGATGEACDQNKSRHGHWRAGQSGTLHDGGVVGLCSLMALLHNSCVR